MHSFLIYCMKLSRSLFWFFFKNHPNVVSATLLSDAFVSLFTFFITWAVPSIYFYFFFSLLCECHHFWKIKYDATGQETAWSILYAVQKHFVWCVLVCVRWVWVAVVLKSCVLQKHGLIHTAPLCVLWSNLLSWPLFFKFMLCSMLLDALSNQVHYM